MCWKNSVSDSDRQPDSDPHLIGAWIRIVIPNADPDPDLWMSIQLCYTLILVTVRAKIREEEYSFRNNLMWKNTGSTTVQPEDKRIQTTLQPYKEEYSFY
jgi:hypothetical protein